MELHPIRSRRDLPGLAAWLALTFSAAVAGSLLTAPGLRGWYEQLVKPSWTPPDEVFGPVWTVLYAAMGVSAWRVWRAPAPAGRALAVFAVQLALNVAWSGVFFGLRQPGAAVGVIAALWAAIALTIREFRRIDGPAAWLLVPYLAWVSFAAALNLVIWRANAG